jgi:hypothetical protein
LHFAERTLDGKLVAQIAKNSLHAVISAQDVTSGHIPLQRVEIVPTNFRETLKQSAAHEPGRSGH